MGCTFVLVLDISGDGVQVPSRRKNDLAQSSTLRTSSTRRRTNHIQPKTSVKEFQLINAFG